MSTRAAGVQQEARGTGYYYHSTVPHFLARPVRTRTPEIRPDAEGSLAVLLSSPILRQ